MWHVSLCHSHYIIKKKFVTAITTAGLLAGLFGSAFVPVARAASAATGTITTANGDGVVSSVQYFSSAVNPALSAAVDISAATDDGLFEVTISGGTFKAASVVDAGTGAPAISGTVVSTTSISTLMVAGNADQSITFSLVLNKLAAGSTATITLIDPDGDTLATMTATGRTAETGVISATKSTLAKNAVGDVTTTAGVEYIDASAAFVLDGALKDSNSGAITSTPTLLVTIDVGSVSVGSDSTAANARTAATADAGNKAAVRTVTLNASGLYAINVFHPGADSAGGTYTVTVKNAATAAVLSTYTGGFIGAASTVTATALATNIASVTANTTDFYTVSVKDRNGIEWHQAAYSVAVTAKDETGTAQATFVDGSTDGDTDRKFDYDVDTCATGKTGKTRTITFTSSAGITINTKPTATVTLTCRADATAAYTLSSLAFAKAQPLAGEVINLTFGYVDALGAVAGYGAVVTAANYVVSLVGGTSIAVTDGVGSDITADNDIDAAQTIVSNDGTFFVGVKSATTVGTVMQATIPSSSVVATAVTTDSSYSGSLTAGAKKLKATASFGAAAAGKKVAFVLESASGTVKTFYRKANASGVATYTLRMRGTWEVYATFGDSITDAVNLKK